MYKLHLIKSDHDPYKDGTWQDSKWFCIRCGSELDPIDKNDEELGKWSWRHMMDDGTQWYRCSNDSCTHHTNPLILHHPLRGWKWPAENDYSISWIQ